MKRVLSLVTLAVLTSASMASAQAPAAANAPTFTKDVAPIFYNNCVLCHRPGEVAPMSLITYSDARPWAKAIKQKVVSREMPPWFADSATSRKLKNDRQLSQKDIDTIAKWVDAGSPQGDAKDLPPVPQFAGSWVYGEPDAVVQMAVPRHLPAEGEIDNEVNYAPFGFTEEKFIQAAQMLPTTPYVVHHANMGSAAFPAGTKLIDGKPFGPDGKELDRRQIRNADAPTLVASDASKIICYVPGRGWERWPDGVGKRIPVGAYARFNMHYQATGKPEVDQTRLGMWFAKGTVKHELFNSSLEDVYIVEGKELQGESEELQDAGDSRLPKIPAYADNWRLVSVAGIREATTIYGFSPHMHLRGKDMKYMVTYPDGREETLLNVPRYDFNWQLYYELEEPAKLPAGSKLVIVSHFDNSLKNPYNPAPHLDVNWSEQSWDEMYNPQMRFTVDSWDLTKPKANTQQQQQQQQ